MSASGQAFFEPHECAECDGGLKKNAPGVDTSEAPWFEHIVPDGDGGTTTVYLCSAECMARYLFGDLFDALDDVASAIGFAGEDLQYAEDPVAAGKNLRIGANALADALDDLDGGDDDGE